MLRSTFTFFVKFVKLFLYIFCVYELRLLSFIISLFILSSSFNLYRIVALFCLRTLLHKEAITGLPIPPPRRNSTSLPPAASTGTHMSRHWCNTGTPLRSDAFSSLQVGKKKKDTTILYNRLLFACVVTINLKSDPRRESSAQHLKTSKIGFALR